VLYCGAGPEAGGAGGDQVTCGQCGQRFPLADLTAFVQHKMAANCSGPEEAGAAANSSRPEAAAAARTEEEEAEAMARTKARASLSSPRVSGTDEVVKKEDEEDSSSSKRRRRTRTGPEDIRAEDEAAGTGVL